MKKLALIAILPLLAVGCVQPPPYEENSNLKAQNVELQKELDNTRAALDTLQRDLATKDTQINRLKGDNAQLRDALAAAQAAQPAPAPAPAPKDDGFGGIAGVESETNGAGVTIRIEGDVLFAPGSAEVKADAKKALNRIAAVLKEKYAGHTIRVAGHTDSDPISHSKWKDNWELSATRALAVLRVLEKDGQVPSAALYAAGFGEHHPRNNKKASRRVEIFVER